MKLLWRSIFIGNNDGKTSVFERLRQVLLCIIVTQGPTNEYARSEVSAIALCQQTEILLNTQ